MLTVYLACLIGFVPEMEALQLAKGRKAREVGHSPEDHLLTVASSISRTMARYVITASSIRPFALARSATSPAVR